MVVGPENAFAIIRDGTKQDIRSQERLANAVGTETPAPVLISDMRKNFPLAPVGPRSLREALRKGNSPL